MYYVKIYKIGSTIVLFFNVYLAKDVKKLIMCTKCKGWKYAMYNEQNKPNVSGEWVPENNLEI